MLFEVQAKWVLRVPTQFGSRSQNRFCLYLDPPIGPFSPKCKKSFWLSGLLHARLLVFKDPIFCENDKTSIRSI